jgi:DNA-binding response OmpR family regulator
MKLLIVEDDMLLQEGLALALTAEGYTLDCAATAAEADGLIQSGEYSLVILDLGLPDKDGATLLSQWRRRGVANPVLILTARGTEHAGCSEHHPAGGDLQPGLLGAAGGSLRYPADGDPGDLYG